MKLFDWTYEERDLHEYIIEAYRNQGFECFNFHESGSSVEEGVDILAIKGGTKIAIAVKIKPQKSDLKQLKKLVSAKARTKQYVYIETPTKPFFDGLNKLESKGVLTSVNDAALHDFLVRNKSTKYLERYIFSNKVFVSLKKIMQIWYSEREVSKSRVSKEDLQMMWDWKDRAVSFHKSVKSFRDYNSSRIKKIVSEKDYPYPELIKDAWDIFTYLDTEGNQLAEVFQEIKKTKPGLLSSMWSKCIIRSNWCELLSPMSATNNRRDIDEIMFTWFYRNISTAPYTFIEGTYDQLYELANDIEEAIDWIFADRR